MSIELRLQPVDASFSLKDHIYRVLKDSIMELDIYNPEVSLRMDERRLAESLGISRTPVREALMRLEQEGFVETRARRGVFIQRKSLEEILEMITVWAALESMAARLACAEATDEEIAELRKIGGVYTASEASAHIQEYSERNIDFHLCILGLSKCNMLQEIAEGLFTHLKVIRRNGMKDKARASQSVVDHIHIIEAIESRKPDLASDLVREHTMRLREYIRDSWKHIAGETAEDA